MPSKKVLFLIVVMGISIVVLCYYGGLIGVAISLPWSLLILFLTNMEAVSSFAASSYKWASKVNFWFEKNAVQKRLEVTIGLSSKKVNQEAGMELLPHGIEIKWDEPNNREAFIKRGKMVVCLEASQNEERNLARATMMYIQEDLISQSQRFVDPHTMKSICFTVAKRMLLADRKTSAVRCLNTEYIEPEVEKDPRIRDYMASMDDLDKEGLFTRVLLREFSQFDAQLSPALTSNQAMHESIAFTDFLSKIVRKKAGEQVNLFFNGEILRIDVILVADMNRFSSIDNFVKAAQFAAKFEANTVYVMSTGQLNAMARLVVSAIENAKIYSKFTEWNYQIRGRNNRLLPVYVAELHRLT